jgi:hypothetical protein
MNAHARRHRWLLRDIVDSPHRSTVCRSKPRQFYNDQTGSLEPTRRDGTVPCPRMLGMGLLGPTRLRAHQSTAMLAANSGAIPHGYNANRDVAIQELIGGATACIGRRTDSRWTAGPIGGCLRGGNPSRPIRTSAPRRHDERLFGPSQQAPQIEEAAGEPNAPLDYGDAARDAQYRAHGGVSGRGRYGGVWQVGGLAIEDKEKLWNWAVAYTAVTLTIQFATFAFLSYTDVLRAVG